jgi:Spy/CpxP family protein refolding chaperone
MSGGRLSATTRSDAAPHFQQPAARPAQPSSGRSMGPVPGPNSTGPSASSRGDFSPWWKDAGIVRELGLTADQVGKIDRLYEKRRKAIQLQLDEFDKQKAELDRLIGERTVSPEVVELHTSKMMTPRIAIDTSRIRMLYEMSRVMTAEQNRKLQDIFHQRTRENGRGRNSSSR